MAVNAVASLWQVEGQQVVVGPTKYQGRVGGGIFVAAL